MQHPNRYLNIEKYKGGYESLLTLVNGYNSPNGVNFKALQVFLIFINVYDKYT